MLDLLTKRAIAQAFVPGERITLIPDWLYLTYARNRHGAMGFFGDRAWLLILLALVVVAALAFLLRGLVRRSPLVQIGFGLVLGGAAGNVYDRALHHYVIDFIAPRWFYVFNGADACITVGLALIAFVGLREPKRA